MFTLSDQTCTLAHFNVCTEYMDRIEAYATTELGVEMGVAL